MRPADSATSTALLADIAATLGIPVEAFKDPACLDDIRRARTELFAEMLAVDAEFLRVAQAFLNVQDPAGRRAIAETVEAIAGAFTQRLSLREQG